MIPRRLSTSTLSILIPLALLVSLGCSNLTPMTGLEPEEGEEGRSTPQAGESPQAEETEETGDTFLLIEPEDTAPVFGDDDDDTPPEPAVPFADDFTDCSPDWQLSVPWECGVPTSGPHSARVGTQLLATNLSGNYPNNLRWETAAATSPAFTVPAGGATLSFQAWWDVEPPGLFLDYDGWHVRVLLPNGNATVLSTSRSYNVRVGGYSGWAGSTNAWVNITASLSNWAGQEIRLQFGMYSDPSVTRAGAYIDDIRVE